MYRPAAMIDYKILLQWAPFVMNAKVYIVTAVFTVALAVLPVKHRFSALPLIGVYF